MSKQQVTLEIVDGYVIDDGPQPRFPREGEIYLDGKFHARHGGGCCDRAFGYKRIILKESHDQLDQLEVEETWEEKRIKQLEDEVCELERKIVKLKEYTPTHKDRSLLKAEVIEELIKGKRGSLSVPMLRDYAIGLRAGHMK